MSGTLCGHIDPPLNAVGWRQSSNLACLLRHHDIRMLYASDLLRAVQTAAVLKEALGVGVVVRPDLREISFGAWEGRSWSELRTNGLCSGIQGFESSPDICAPGGESFVHFRERALRALKHIASGTEKHPIGIVTHIGVIRVALRYLGGAGYPNRQQPIHPCSVYRFAVIDEAFTYAGRLTTP
jgi:alpha-ribazole phosphatase/probable phosphoglycerate mutase